jgi:C-terminal peptidase prc
MRGLGRLASWDACSGELKLRRAGGLFSISSMIKSILAASLAYMAGGHLALATPLPKNRSTDNCVSQFQKKGPEAIGNGNADSSQTGALTPETLELKIMAQIISRHFNAQGIDYNNVPIAHDNFFKIIDPFGFLLTEAEIQSYKNMNPEMMNALVMNVFAKGDRRFYLSIANGVRSRLDQLVNLFSKEKELREEIKALALQIIDEPEDIKHEPPKTTDDIFPAYKRYLAEIIANLMSEDYAKLNPEAKKLDLDGAFLIMIREIRPLMVNHLMRLHPNNLPFLIAKSYAKSLDPHTDLFLPDEVSSFASRLSGNFVGIGVESRPHPQGMHIKSVLEDSSAETHGLLKGDIITHIRLREQDEVESRSQFVKSLGKNDWVNIRALAFTEFVALVHGKEDSEIVLKVLRDGQILEIKLPRKPISRDEQLIHVELRSTAEGNIAHIEFRSFYNDSAAQLRAKILELKKKDNLKAIILSLRGNGGGPVDEFAEILGFFVPKGLAMYFHGKKNNRGVNIPTEFTPIWDGPLVVMTDSSSASASEALAQSLKDYKRAIIIGETTTHGKGSMQSVHIIGNFGIKVTEALYHTASGWSPQFRGVKSDIILPYTITPKYEYERDLPGAIKPEALDLKVPAETLNQVAVPHLEALKLQLAELSKQRSSPITSGNSDLTDKEKFDKNTEEGLKITEDFIRLLGGIN